jgi:pSer/pThr/pTyr-binding forkhead associated (FHA) protein
MIYLLTPDSNEVTYKVGRANDQDVRINDISSSRFHANIIFDGETFKIKDNVSKFGTLAEIKTELVIKPN